MIIVCLGLPRSGSTLQFNILRMLSVQLGWDVLEWSKSSELIEIVNQKLVDQAQVIVFKTHTLPLGLLNIGQPIKVLTTYRDFRDVAASNKVAFDNSVDKTIKVLSDALTDLQNLRETGIPIYTGIYSIFKDDIIGETMRIGEFLGIEVSNSIASEIQEACNVEKAFKASVSDKVGFFQTLKRRALLYLGIAPYKDKLLRLHHNHVSQRKGASNYYSDVLTVAEISKIEIELNCFVKELEKPNAD